MELNVYMNVHARSRYFVNSYLIVSPLGHEYQHSVNNDEYTNEDIYDYNFDWMA